MNFSPSTDRAFISYLKYLVLSLSSVCLLLPSISWSDQSSARPADSIENICSDYLNTLSTFTTNLDPKYKSNPILGDFDPRLAFINMNLNPKKVQVFFVKEYHFESDAILVQIVYDGHALGQITLIQDEKIEYVWHTDLTLLFDDNFKSKGLGFLMYLIAAAKFYEDYPDFELHGSADQSEDAKKLWQRLINSNFAEKLVPLQTELESSSNQARIVKENLGPKLKRFVKPYTILTPKFN